MLPSSHPAPLPILCPLRKTVICSLPCALPPPRARTKPWTVTESPTSLLIWESIVQMTSFSATEYERPATAPLSLAPTLHPLLKCVHIPTSLCHCCLANDSPFHFSPFCSQLPEPSCDGMSLTKGLAGSSSQGTSWLQLFLQNSWRCRSPGQEFQKESHGKDCLPTLETR